MKLYAVETGGQVYGVAPPVGAWIEMEVLPQDRKRAEVAPPVGAWIEMQTKIPVKIYTLPSLPPWERGLK